MTEMPPPPGVPYQPGVNQRTTQQAQTNVWSIISLICGILGCLFITPIVAIVTGIVGVVQAKTLKTGRGMAIAGIILGLLWIVGGIAMVGAVRYGGSAIISALGGAVLKPSISTSFNDLADGNTAAAKTYMPSLSDDELDTLAAELKPMGHVKMIDFSSFNANNTNGQKDFTFTRHRHVR